MIKDNLILLMIITFIIFLITPEPSMAQKYGGVEFPDGETSFADKIIDYKPGPGVGDSYDDTSNALGIPNEDHVCLGDEGILIVQFTNNSLTTSGDDAEDLWIFEVGPKIEPTTVYISTNGTNWINVGFTSGSTSGVDIDAYVSSGVIVGQKYSFVKIVDLLPNQSGSPYAGADIDAIGVISSDIPVPIIANAGPDQVVFNEITLDASKSYPFDQIRLFQWNIKQVDNSYNTDIQGVAPIISNLNKGFYEVTLTVKNDKGEQSSDSMLFSATGTEHCLSGDHNLNAKLDIGDVIGILNEITSESNFLIYTSCKSILDNGLSKGNGYYQINPIFDNNEETIEVFCDMTTSGGGWMKVSNQLIYSNDWVNFQNLYGDTSSSITNNSFDLTMNEKTNSGIRADINVPHYFTQIKGSWTLKKGNHPDDTQSITKWGDKNPTDSTKCGGIIAFGTSENIIKKGGEWKASGGYTADKKYSFETQTVLKTNLIRFENHQQCADNEEESVTIKDLEIFIR